MATGAFDPTYRPRAAVRAAASRNATRPAPPPEPLEDASALLRGAVRLVARALRRPMRGLLWVADEVWQGYPPTTEEMRARREA